jgi:hypothetical protein
LGPTRPVQAEVPLGMRTNDRERLLTKRATGIFDSALSRFSAHTHMCASRNRVRAKFSASRSSFAPLYVTSAPSQDKSSFLFIEFLD